MLAGAAQKVKRRLTHLADDRGRLLYAAGTLVGLRSHAMGRFFVSITTAILGAATIVAAQSPHTFLVQPPRAALRVLTWNVSRSSIFPQEGEVVDISAANRPAQFARVLRALRPDVLCLQEVTVSVTRSAALVNHILPLPDGQSWQAHSGVDTVIISRFKLSARSEGHVQDGERRRGHAMALIGTPAADLFMICAHFQSSNSPEEAALRQQQAQSIASTIRDAKAGVGAIPLPARTPFIVLGDFNAIAGATAFVDAIVSGRAADAGGRAERLDWDHSSLTDALPRHNASGSERYTWRNDLEQFPPGILDRIVYSDSVLGSLNQFVLDTTAMSYDELVSAGLRAIDVMLDPQSGIHDHFPLVIDVSFRPDGRRR
jgi:endonuclease/exonuclease/phosphatase family metal-dependent hydrolase